MVSLTLTPPAPWQAAHTVATFALPASMSAACASGAIIRTTDNPSSFFMALLPLRRDMLPEEPRHGRAADGQHRRGARGLQQRPDHPELVGPDEALHPDHAAGRAEPAARGLQHLPAGAQRAVFGQRRSRRRHAFPAGALRQARIELLPGLVRDLDPAWGLKTVNQRMPTLIGTPPLIAVTPGSVVCSRRTGRVFISCRKASVVILNVRAV